MPFDKITQKSWEKIVRTHDYDPGNSHIITGMRKMIRLNRPELYTVLKKNGTVVGSYVLICNGRNCRLFLIDVFAKYRRQGHGARLLSHAIETAQQNSNHQILKITGAHGARAFYKANGHVPVRSTTNRDYYEIQL